jgi:DNA-binding response OmpR family regulator
MVQTVEAEIDERGGIRLLQPVHIARARRALVVILDEKPTTGISDLWQDGATREATSDEDAPKIERVLQDKPSSTQQGLAMDDEGDCWVEGRPVPTLTSMEHKLLLHLYSRANAIVSRDELCQLLWPNEPDVDGFSALEKLVSRVRTKVEPNPDHPYFLVTVRGRGYRLRLT